MKRLLFLALLLSNLNHSFANSTPFLSITYPTERMIFQRNVSNQATVYFSAQYTKAIAVTASYRFQPLDLNTGNASGSASTWTNIGFNNTVGTYRSLIGSVTLSKGWYYLEIRVLNSSNVLIETTRIKIGVGDIFVIAGQSNSQGYIGADDPDVIPYYRNGATDTQLPDAVNICTLSVTNEDFNFVPTKRGPIKQSVVRFEKIKQRGNRIYPNGADSWCYAELGKDIVTTTQCPVAFFNAGASGSDIENWTESIPQNPVTKGLTHFRFAFNRLGQGCIYDPQNAIDSCNVDFFGKFPTTPYVPFRNTLQTFCSLMGVRAILWHQGETDSERNGGSNFSYYITNFDILKNRVKTDFRDENNNPQNNLSWFVSKVSWWRSYPDDNSKPIPIWSDQTNSNLISQQTLLGNNNYVGANTDNIRMQSNPTNPNDSTRARKLDGFNVHFSNYGLRMLADRWLATQPWTGNPIAGKPLLPLTVTASGFGDNRFNISAPAGYATYIWVISGGLFSNYLYKGSTLNDVKLFSNQTIMCYVSKSSDPNEQNFFPCQPIAASRETFSFYADFLSFYSPNKDFLVTPSPVGQKAYNYISATNAIQNNGTTVNYQAGKAVILENGFTAEKGTVFKAEIVSIPDAPQTWTSDNIGSGSGTSLFSNQVLSITGYGSLGGYTDNVHFYHANYSSDVVVVARIDGMSSTDGHRAGIMIRNSLANNSGFYEFIIDGNGNVGKIKRKNAGDFGDLYGFAQCPPSGSWIKVEKSGNTIRCFFKPTDNYPNWLEVIGWDDHSDNNFTPNFQIGFVAYNGASAIFSNISVNGTVVN